MIPITNKGVTIGECYDTMKEALDRIGATGYTQATILIDEQKLYCVLFDDNAFKQAMKQTPGACYAFVRKEH